MKFLAIFLVGLASLFASGASAQEKVGVVLMHGKQGGGPRDGSLESLHRKMQEAGMLVIKPEMPWSFGRYIEGIGLIAPKIQCRSLACGDQEEESQREQQRRHG